MNLWFRAKSVCYRGHSTPFNRLTFGFGFYIFNAMSVQNLMIVWFVSFFSSSSWEFLILKLFGKRFFFRHVSVCILIGDEMRKIQVKADKSNCLSLELRAWPLNQIRYIQYTILCCKMQLPIGEGNQFNYHGETFFNKFDVNHHKNHNRKKDLLVERLN